LLDQCHVLLLASGDADLQLAYYVVHAELPEIAVMLRPQPIGEELACRQQTMIMQKPIRIGNHRNVLWAKEIGRWA
jgi:hypothetical protein